MPPLILMTLGTLTILVVNAAMAAAFVGLGLQLRRWFVGSAPTFDDVCVAFWTGFAAVLTFLMLWHFLWPVNPVALTAVMVGGLVAATMNRRRLATPSWEEAAWGLLFSLWVAHLSTGAMTMWDSALYHMQGVKWAREFAIVPGIVNLFGPLGFNNATWLYDAMMDAGPFRGRAWHVCNGLLVSAFGFTIIATAVRAWKSAGPPPASSIFVLLLLAPTVDFALFGRVSSFVTVEPASLLIMVAAMILYRALSEPAATADERAYQLVTAVGVSAVAVAAKSSAAVFAAGVGIVVIAKLRGVEQAEICRRALRWAATAVVVVAATWVTRGVILSGYVLFPQPFLSVPVSWKAPAEHARAELDYIVLAARGIAWTSEYLTEDYAHLPHWIWRWIRTLRVDLYDVVVPVGVAGVSLAIGWATLWRRGLRATARRPTVWLLLPLGTAIAAWFITAPMPYYGKPFLWCLAAWVGAEIYAASGLRPETRRGVIVATCALGLSPAVVTPAFSAWRSEGWAAIPGALARAHLKIPTRGSWFQEGEARSPYVQITTRSGLVLNVPVGQRGKCWDAPLPCTPNPAPNLRLRNPERLDSGFVVDGNWQMRDWPEREHPMLLPFLRQHWWTNSR